MFFPEPVLFGQQSHKKSSFVSIFFKDVQSLKMPQAYFGSLHDFALPNTFLSENEEVTSNEHTTMHQSDP